jgi:outer membrane protein assembly factor BamB
MIRRRRIPRVNHVALAAVLLSSALVVSASAVPGAALGLRHGSAPAIDFPAFMHDAAHSAYSPSATSIAPTSALSEAWHFKADKIAGQPSRGFVATPVVVGHVIFIGSNSGEFYAINELTGKTIWKEFLGFEAKFECGAARGFDATTVAGTDPTSGAPTVYASSGDGNVYALRESDGAVLWKSPVNVPTPGMNDYYAFSSPEMANGKIYVGMSSYCDEPLIRGGLAALDQATGNRVATYYTVPDGQVGGSVWSSPAVAPDGSVVITTGNATNGALIGTAQSVVRLDGSTLAPLDSYQLVTKGGDSDFGGSPTIFAATINGVSTAMVGACNKNGYYYAWQLGNLAAGPVWKDQIGLTGHKSGGEICISGAIWDGSNLYVGGTPITIGGVLYRGSIRKLDPATGAPVWLTGLPAAVMTTPTMDGAGAIVATGYDFDPTVTNSAFLIDSATGSFVTVDDGGVRAAPSGVFADSYLLIATNAGKIYAYQAQ